MSNQQLPFTYPAAALGIVAPERSNVAALPLTAVGDGALVAALLSGSHRAATAIWQRHSPAVRRTLARSMGPDQELDDLLQEVFLGFVKSAAKLEDPNNLRAYLVSIAFRTAAMEIRRRKVRRWVTLTLSGEVPDALAVHSEPDETRALRALYRILDALSARERLVFVARYVEGMQIDETAAALGLSKATVWRSGKAAFERVLVKAQREPALVGYIGRSLARADS